MIIFHEGLPGSGKSYEAAINQIIPALKKGRTIYAYIEGLNHSKFSEVTGIPLDTITRLLHQLAKEQVKDIYTHVQNDSLVIIDELQDHFPVGRTQLDAGITEFVTQHRHRGIDIVCMGQDHRDCHNLWKRRIDTLITFTKRDALGFKGSYTWKTFKQTNCKFIELRKGKGTYDSKYFGLYASHSDNVTSIDAHTDDRSNVFKSKTFTFWLPLFIVGFIYAMYYLWGFFHSPIVEIKQPPKSQVIQQPQQPVLSPLPTSQPLSSVPIQHPADTQQVQPAKPLFQAKELNNFVERYFEENRPRLSGFMVSSKTKKLYARVDFYKDDRVIESFNIEQLKDFGYTVEQKSYGLLVTKKDKSYPVTMWPLDIQRNVPDRIRPSLRDESEESPVIQAKR
jgi:zona occludens toxin